MAHTDIYHTKIYISVNIKITLNRIYQQSVKNVEKFFNTKTNTAFYLKQYFCVCVPQIPLHNYCYLATNHFKSRENLAFYTKLFQG